MVNIFFTPDLCRLLEPLWGHQISFIKLYKISTMYVLVAQAPESEDLHSNPGSIRNILLNLYHDNHKSMSVVAHWSASSLSFSPQGSRLLLPIVLLSHNHQWYSFVISPEMHLTDTHNKTHFT